MPVPNWGDIPTWLTAVGTIAVAVAAVWIALWSERRTDKRLADEHTRSAGQLAKEQAHSAELLASEQAFSKAQLEEERSLGREREQLAEAYAVQVIQAEKPVGPPMDEVHEEPDPDVRSLVAIVVNHSTYTITRVEAQFHLHSNNGAGSLVPTSRTEWISGYPDLGERLRVGLDGPPEYNPHIGRLAPWDTGMRFDSGGHAAKFVLGWYPVVRWTDRWGTRWEYKQGDVHQVGEGEEWKP